MGCAGKVIQTRQPSSETIQSSEIDIQTSTIKFFSPHKTKQGFDFYLLIELFDADHRVVDAKPDNFVLKNNNRLIPNIEIKKMAVGKYYFIFKSKEIQGSLNLRVFFKSILIKEFSSISLASLDREKSTIAPLHPLEDGMKFRLILKDKKFRNISLGMDPEIVVTGLASVENLEEVEPGVWEFDVIFPNESQFIYISVRAHGELIKNWYRLHYIEK